MRSLVLPAVLVGIGCGRLAFDPVGTGGVVEEDVGARPIIAAGNQFTCVRRGDGSVWCWGDGRRGQLGNGPELPRTTAARVQSLPAVVAIEAGDEFACALTADAEVWCWGDSDVGQVDGSMGGGTKPPTRVPLARPALAVSSGTYHSCAILDDGSVACWGKNSVGQIGKGPISGDHVLQHDVLDRVTAITAGNFHTCAIREGTVWCWGNNGEGQVGNGTQSESVAPTSIGIAATSLSAGGYFTCALDDAGRYRCWGNNAEGMAGVGGAGPILTPAAPSTLDGFVALRAGGSHACALRADDSIWCWGANTLGTLGDGTGDGRSARSLPKQIATPRADVSAGRDHTCAVDDSGAVTCWGVNRLGAVGDPARTASVRSHEVNLPGTPLLIAAGARYACAVLAPNQDLYCWGENDSGQLALPAAGATGSPTATGVANVDDLAAGEDHSCATIAGTLRCWGDNDNGQLGDGTTVSRHEPIPVAMNLSGVASGRDFSCGISGGNVYCWGSNNFGELGAGTSEQSTPTMVPGVTATNLDLGIDHACALDGNTATCWGWNEAGQLGRGTQSISETPGVISGAPSWVTLTAGAEHTCGSTAAGELFCWGANYRGMLGTGDETLRTSPAMVVASGGREIAARGNHTCAEINGLATCWGNNESGQIGDATHDIAHAPTPVVDVPAGVTMFALGDDFSCVLGTDDKVRCWGDNTYGQLGLGVLGFVPSPYSVALP